MIINEKGQILPITLIFSLFFIALLYHQINLYMVDQKFLKATEDLYIIENLMQVTAKEVVLHTPSGRVSSGKNEYSEGSVTYAVKPLTLSTSRVSITCTTKSGGEFKAEFTYDYVLQKMKNWNDVR